MKDTDWDRILHSTWSHNEYFELMLEVFYKKYPLKRSECHANVWADPVVKSEDYMRDLMMRIETYWKGHITSLLGEIGSLKDMMKEVAVMGEPVQCDICNEYYDASEDSRCMECCALCQGVADDIELDDCCSSCQEEVVGDIEERDAIIRGDYI